MPLAEAQSEWIGDVLEGKAKLPSVKAMRNVIAREDERMARRYVASKRHTIQVDFYPYLRTLERERGASGGSAASPPRWLAARTSCGRPGERPSRLSAAPV